MRKLLIATFLVVASSMAAHADILTDLTLEVNSQLPSNPTGQITAARLRQVLIDLATGVLNQQQVANPKHFGAICDGSSHPLSSSFPSLSAAQGKYPFVTSLSQEIDYAALQATSDYALGAAGSEHGASNAGLNIPIYIPQGTCFLGNDTWTIRKAAGIKITGAGRLATKLTGNNTILSTDGLWYSQIDGVQFYTLNNTAPAALDIDGNVPGHPYATFSVQGNTIKDVQVVGGDHTFSMCRLGGSGSQCSENQYIDLHVLVCGFACYYQNGFNAIDNNWFGGDVQSFAQNGVFLVAGSLGLYKVSFESGYGYQQIVNDGWDINASSAGVGDTINVTGARTESMRFYKGGPAQIPDLRGINHQPSALGAWTAAHAYLLNDMVKAADPTGKLRAYRVTTAGTSGGSAPTFPASGTVTDGTAVWTQTDYTVISTQSGAVDFRTSSIDPTATVSAQDTRYLSVVEINADYTAKRDDSMVLAYPSSAGMTITLTDDAAFASNMGHAVTVKRANTGAHDVIVTSPTMSGGPVTLPSGTLDSVTFVHAGANLGGPIWYMTNYTATNSH